MRPNEFIRELETKSAEFLYSAYLSLWMQLEFCFQKINMSSQLVTASCMLPSFEQAWQSIPLTNSS